MKRGEGDVLLDGVNHLGLELRRQVVVNYTKSSEKLYEDVRNCYQFSAHFEIAKPGSTYSDSDSHFSLCNGIHRGREERSFEDSLLCDP